MKVDVQTQVRTLAAEQSQRWNAINSAMAGISNAIELCEIAGLRELSDRLLVLQRDALRERERA